MNKPTKPRGGKIDFTIPEMFPLIENGSKYVTIRKHRKNGLEVGGILKVYLGNRFHGDQRFLGTAEILALENVTFQEDYPAIKFYRPIDDSPKDLYQKDGFHTFTDFIKYHLDGKAIVHKQIITFGNQSWLN